MLAAKAAPAAAAPPAKGTVIRSTDAPGPNGGVLAAKPSAEPRALGETTPGPDVPFEWASEKSSEAARQWLLARQQPENLLGIVLDPSGETTAHAWLAIENPSDPGRFIFLHRLPLLTPRKGEDPY